MYQTAITERCQNILTFLVRHTGITHTNLLTINQENMQAEISKSKNSNGVQSFHSGIFRSSFPIFLNVNEIDAPIYPI